MTKIRHAKIEVAVLLWDSSVVESVENMARERIDLWRGRYVEEIDEPVGETPHRLRGHRGYGRRAIHDKDPVSRSGGVEATPRSTKLGQAHLRR